MAESGEQASHHPNQERGPSVREAIASVMPVERLRWLGLSHLEAEELVKVGLADGLIGRPADW